MSSGLLRPQAGEGFFFRAGAKLCRTGAL